MLWSSGSLLFLSFFYFLQRRCDQPRVLCGLSCRDHWWKSRLYQHWQLRWLLAWEACWIEASFRAQKTLSWKSEWVRNIIFLASAIVEFGSPLFQDSEKLSQFWVAQVEQLHRTGLGQQLHEVPQLGSSSRGTDFLCPVRLHRLHRFSTKKRHFRHFQSRNSFWLRCPVGSYSNVSGATDSSTCLPCPKGTYQPIEVG